MLTPSPIRSPSSSSTTSPRWTPDAEFNSPVLRHAGVALRHRVLHFDRAPHRVDHAAELDDGAVAGALDHPALVHGDGGIDEIAAQRPEPREGAVLVGAGQPAKADHIGSEDRGELAGSSSRASPSGRATKLGRAGAE